MTPEQVIQEVKTSELSGAGGAGFPTGIKLETVRKATGPGDESSWWSTGTRATPARTSTRSCSSATPTGQLEGVLIAAYAAGAREAIVYIRFEYPRAIAVMKAAIEEARAAGLIGSALFGSDFSCDVRVQQGQGAYICGEETSLLRSIEGVPADRELQAPDSPRRRVCGAARPPSTTWRLCIICRGSWNTAARPTRSWAWNGHAGTKLVSLNTRVKRPGLYEIELGMTLREVIFGLGGGMEDGERFKAVQVGGPSAASSRASPRHPARLRADDESRRHARPCLASSCTRKRTT
jgi:NADH-quinone oxidoreductase subunit F